jgi:hypothetical protein
MAILMPATILNMVLFLAGAFVLGGTALNGYIENGHYFVADHARITEVTGAQWVYSCIHTSFMIANVLVLAVVFFWLWFSGDIDI